MDRWPAGEVDERLVSELLEQCSDESALRLSTRADAVAIPPTMRSTGAEITIPSSSSDSLDPELFARFNRLKLLPPHPATCAPLADPAEVDVLGSHLAARLAALKSLASAPQRTSSGGGHDSLRGKDSSAIQNPKGASTQENAKLGSHESGADDSEESVCDLVRKEIEGNKKGNPTDLDVVLECNQISTYCNEKQRTLKLAHELDSDSSEGEISDTEVDRMAEWAKDAARLDTCDGDEEDDIREEAAHGTDEDEVDYCGLSASSSAKDTSLNKKMKSKSGWKFW